MHLRFYYDGKLLLFRKYIFTSGMKSFGSTKNDYLLSTKYNLME